MKDILNKLEVQSQSDLHDDFVRSLFSEAAVEIERLRKDAERYRWLRANKNRTREGNHMNPAFCGVTFYHYSPVIGAGPNLDEAIDAAMREQGANT